MYDREPLYELLTVVVVDVCVVSVFSHTSIYSNFPLTPGGTYRDDWSSAMTGPRDVFVFSCWNKIDPIQEWLMEGRMRNKKLGLRRRRLLFFFFFWHEKNGNGWQSAIATSEVL